MFLHIEKVILSVHILIIIITKQFLLCDPSPFHFTLITIITKDNHCSNPLLRNVILSFPLLLKAIATVRQ